VKSLLSIHYPNYEVVLVNDGSRDRTLLRLIEEYQLEEVDFSVHYALKTKKVRAVYKSKNPTYSNLLVVDKENGGSQMHLMRP